MPEFYIGTNINLLAAAYRADADPPIFMPGHNAKHRVPQNSGSRALFSTLELQSPIVGWDPRIVSARALRRHPALLKLSVDAARNATVTFGAYR